MKPERKERFDMTLSLEEKVSFTEAAELNGFSTLSQYVRATMTRVSREIQLAHNELISSKEDRDKFHELLLHPPEPNEALVDLLINEEDRVIAEEAPQRQI